MRIENLEIYTDQAYDCKSWVCYDENYDGAPDAGLQLEGVGRTEEEAIADYLENKRLG